MDFDISPTLEKLQGMARGFLALLPNLILGFVVLGLFVLLAKWANRLVKGFCQTHGKHENVGIVIGRLAYSFLVFLGLLVSLSITLPSFKAADLIQILGIGSVAVGFAFRDVLQNFLAGILILLTQPFRVGEEIAVKGYQGYVQEIQTRATLIKTSDGFLVVIPNSIIYTENITIFNAFDTRRTVFDILISKDVDIEAARELMVETAKGIEGVLENPAPSARVVGVMGRWLKVQVRWWTDTKHSDDVKVRDKVIPAIMRRASEHDFYVYR
jgi:small conductance mechanosensitive channel